MNREKQGERGDMKWENCCVVKYSIIRKRRKENKIVKKKKKKESRRERKRKKQVDKQESWRKRETEDEVGMEGGEFELPHPPPPSPLPFLEDKWLMVYKQCFFSSLSQNLPSWLPLGWQLSIRAPLVWRTALYCRQLMLSFRSQIRLERYHERSNSQ